LESRGDRAEGGKPQEHSKEWLCHMSAENPRAAGQAPPYRDGLEYRGLGGGVECAKAAAELPHSKGDGV